MFTSQLLQQIDVIMMHHIRLQCLTFFLRPTQTITFTRVAEYHFASFPRRACLIKFCLAPHLGLPIVYMPDILMSSMKTRRAAAFVANAPPSECPARNSFRVLPSSLYSALMTSYIPPESQMLLRPASKPCDSVEWSESYPIDRIALQRNPVHSTACVFGRDGIANPMCLYRSSITTLSQRFARHFMEQSAGGNSMT